MSRLYSRCRGNSFVTLLTGMEGTSGSRAEKKEIDCDGFPSCFAGRFFNYTIALHRYFIRRFETIMIQLFNNAFFLFLYKVKCFSNTPLH